MAARNNVFGDTVTVAGLLCGQDLAYAAHADRQAHGGDPAWVDAVVVPSASLRVHVGPPASTPCPPTPPPPPPSSWTT